MRFSMPHFPCEFEIPDDWLSEAGMIDFNPRATAYRLDAEAALIPLTAIEPVPRFTSHSKDWRGFDRKRLVRLLRGFVAGDAIEWVPLFEMPQFEFAHSPYRYRVLDGPHRFYGSIAAGFSHLPAVI
jgi:hypothetical protein